MKSRGSIYTPREDPAYDRVGSASWYGELFHGRRTANGEIYDMDRLSAAHPTLPLPVYARVTNLNNGRSHRRPHQRSRTLRARPYHRSVAPLGRGARFPQPGHGHGARQISSPRAAQRRRQLRACLSRKSELGAGCGERKDSQRGSRQLHEQGEAAGAKSREPGSCRGTRSNSRLRATAAASSHGRRCRQRQDEGAGPGPRGAGRHVQEQGQCRARAGRAFDHCAGRCGLDRRARGTLFQREGGAVFRSERGEGCAWRR